jgi:hypothetical protein
MMSWLTPVLRALAILFSLSMIVGYTVISHRRKSTESKEADIAARQKATGVMAAEENAGHGVALNLGERAGLWRALDSTTTPALTAFSGTILKPVSPENAATGLAGSAGAFTINSSFHRFPSTHLEKLGDFDSAGIKKPVPRLMLSGSKSSLGYTGKRSGKAGS